ncbi:MAG: potassium transporter [Candidatus Krumholzibacteriota bacterium]|nr:potassium transporter [Candidatus Krumholzibacteriota bacterium]
MRPGILVIISFAAAALAGALLLALPAASTGPRLGFVDALFTSTSAICVTGLVVIDIGTRFTAFGKSVVMVLIQLGGLGVMTFSVFLFLFLGRGLGVRQRWIVTESFTATPIREIPRLIRSIFAFTFLVEGTGAVLLYLHWHGRLPAGEAVFAAVFHAIAAFCNAGFSFFETSFVAWKGSVLLNTTIMALIVVGGLGFPVIYELIGWTRNRRLHRRTAISLHSRMVLWTTAILVVGGTIVIFLLEGTGAMAALGWKERFFTALFQSVTARTAGFNTLDIPALRGATLFILVMLMFVGASPGSCGGGIKTTSVATMAAILSSKIRGRESVSIFRRTIPEETVSRALAIFILAVLVVTAGLIMLLVAEIGPGNPGRTGFLAYAFEAISAFGTVGLSMGITAGLSTAGKFVIIALMFLGRVGLLTVAYVVTRREHVTYFRYAEEKVMIG